MFVRGSLQTPTGEMSQVFIAAAAVTLFVLLIPVPFIVAMDQLSGLLYKFQNVYFCDLA